MIFWTLKLWILLNIGVKFNEHLLFSLSLNIQISNITTRSENFCRVRHWAKVKIFRIRLDYIDNDLFSNFFNNMDSFVETDKLWKKLITQCSKIWSLLFVLHHQDELWIGHSAILVHIKLLDGFLGFLHLNVCEIKMSQSPPDYLPCLPGTPRR